MEQKAGLYLRLSRDDGTGAESESIINQREFLIRYAQEKGFIITEIYEDDGYSGTNFDRPAFQRMIADIEAKKINTVITKDMSRLGRDYIETGNYMERYFPMHHIRYIAVTDNIDTAQGSDDMSPIRSVFNDMYAKDISKKVRTALDTKKQSGKFIGSTAPYGYQKDPADKNHLIIHDATAVYVRYIYTLFLEGNTLLGIANRLSAENIPTPSQSKGSKNASSLWNEAMVKRILTNQTYIGNITQNRVRKINYKVKQCVHLPEQQWITVEGTHNAIIAKEQFFLVQEILKQRNYSKRERNGQTHLLSGLVKCGDCGSSMSFMRENASRSYLVCSNWRRHAKLGVCTSHCIREDTVTEQVIAALSEQVAGCLDTENMISSKIKLVQSSQPADQVRKQKELELERIKTALAELYEEKANQIIGEAQYTEYSAFFQEKRRKLEEGLNNMPQIQGNGIQEKVVHLRKIMNFSQTNAAILRILIKAIYISREKDITIAFHFCRPEKSS